jgi:hypothetical protein
MLPVALAASLLTMGICVGAATQATLPRNRKLWWSRPLVAVLYLLQPLVRGWARYQGRMIFHGPPAGAGESLDSVALRNSAEPLREARYWSSQPINRLALVGHIIRRLEAQGWPCRPDIGWSDYDVEIFGGRWSNLQLITAGEELAPGQHLFCCRMRSGWSLPAKLGFWGLLGFELLLLGILRSWLPWLCLVSVTLPVFFWFLRREERKLRSILTVFLDKFAEDQQLTRVGRTAKDQASTAAGPKAA